jgi:hypothetical protein
MEASKFYDFNNQNNGYFATQDDTSLRDLRLQSPQPHHQNNKTPKPSNPNSPSRNEQQHARPSNLFDPISEEEFN